MTKRCFLGLAAALCGVMQCQAQMLTLDSCRTLAIKNNKELRMSSLKQDAAHWQHQSAVTNYLPKVTAVGTYQRTSREISLLSDEQKDKLSHLGTTMSTAVGQMAPQGVAAFQQALAAFPQSPEGAAMMQNPQLLTVLAQSPALAAMLQNPAIGSQLMAPFISSASTAFQGMLTGMASMLDATGQGIVDAFSTDTRNMTGVAFMLTQPIYMGGKIRAYDKITRYAEQIASEQHDMGLQNLIVSVDEAYWRIVALESKKELAEGFLTLVQKLDGDVEKLIREGLATKADGLSVKVKVNQAEVAVLQVNNGLTLSRMALAQLCGLPLEASFTLDEKGEWSPQAATSLGEGDENVATALANRPEIKALDLAAQVKHQQVNVARSEYLPNVALTGGYLLSNPSLFNGFEKKFGGMWNIGVMVKVPLLTWGDRCYKVRQAKAEASIASLKSEEVREKITLQMNQCQQKMQEATQRYSTALRSQEQADENLRMATLGLQEGVIPVSNVLEAQTAWLAAHSTLVEAEVDARLAHLYLQRALGTLR